MYTESSLLINNKLAQLFIAELLLARVRPNRINDYFASILMTKQNRQVNRAKIIRLSKATFRVAFPCDYRFSGVFYTLNM